MEENGIKHAFVFSPRFQEAYDNSVEFRTVLFGYDSNTFNDMELERDIDVLVHGSLSYENNPWVYPIRNWLAKFLPKIGKENGLKVEQWKHPGYWPAEEERPEGGFTKQYAKILNRTKIAIGGSSFWRLVLKKHLEVPACGSILLTDLPLDNKKFFEGRIIEIDPNYINNGNNYENNLIKTIYSVLESYDESKERFQPFRTERDRFENSYKGRALEMRRILLTI